MADAGLAANPVPAGSRGTWLVAIARQRELSLVAIMVILGGLVTLTAPQFLTVSNISQVAVLASVIAVAAIGESLVVITRNVDLSVEATIGLVAYSVASLLERHALDTPGALVFGLGLGLVLGMINGVVVTVFKVQAIVATLGTLSVFRGIDYLVAGSHQVPLAALPDGFTDAARDSVFGIPIFVLIALGIVIVGSVVLAVVAAVVVGGVNIFGGSGTLAGAAIGALFLGFIANALILVGLSQFWLQAIYGLVILLAISADAIIIRRIRRATAARRVR